MIIQCLNSECFDLPITIQCKSVNSPALSDFHAIVSVNEVVLFTKRRRWTLKG